MLRTGVLAFGVLVSCLSFAQSNPRVAIVPTIHVADSGSARLKQAQATIVNEWLTTSFEQRGFRLTPGSEIRTVFESEKINPFEWEQFTLAKFLKAGQRMRVDYLVVPVITHTEVRRVERPRFTDREGRVEMRLWVYDIAREMPLVNGQRIVEAQGGKPEEIDWQGDEVQALAARRAIQTGMADFLKGFPVRERRSRS